MMKLKDAPVGMVLSDRDGDAWRREEFGATLLPFGMQVTYGDDEIDFVDETHGPFTGGESAVSPSAPEPAKQADPSSDMRLEDMEVGSTWRDCSGDLWRRDATGASCFSCDMWSFYAEESLPRMTREWGPFSPDTCEPPTSVLKDAKPGTALRDRHCGTWTRNCSGAMFHGDTMVPWLESELSDAEEEFGPFEPHGKVASPALQSTGSCPFGLTESEFPTLEPVDDAPSTAGPAPATVLRERRAPCACGCSVSNPGFVCADCMVIAPPVAVHRAPVSPAILEGLDRPGAGRMPYARAVIYDPVSGLAWGRE